jgi:hypothetical protein
MTSGGELTTLYEFADSPAFSSPTAALCLGSDGNLYGTAFGTASGAGGIYRIVFPGAPLAFSLSPERLTTTSTFIQCKINPRGGITVVSLEYGTDGLSFPTQLSIPLSLTGYQAIPVGKPVVGLTPGTTYYFRFRATNRMGEMVSPVKSFSTLAEPMVASAPATDLTPTSARFNGTVNARNYDATVVFEYGTDGNSFPNRVPATPGIVTGDVDVAVSAPVGGLVQGQTYYYRMVATSLAGTTVSGQRSFRTPSTPIATIGSAFGLTMVSARVFGNVNANGSLTSIMFEYGTDGTSFPNSVAATPPTVSGETNLEVSATLNNLVQGTTYYYRVLATSAGGTELSTARTFDLAVLSGFAQVFPGAAPAASGFVLVNVVPPVSGAGWRFVGENQWRAPSLPVAGLTLGEREIEFRPAPGYNHPPRETVILTSEAPFASLERTYYETPVAGQGGLSVILKPDSVIQQVRWRFLGEDDTQWRDSGHTEMELLAGSYLVECKPVTNLVTPAPASVVVGQGQIPAIILTYTEQDTQAGTLTELVPFEVVSTSTNLPYGYVGQIRSDAGLASGFVVKPRVVATAAQVVFNDVYSSNRTPNYVTGVQWLFQSDRGRFFWKTRVAVDSAASWPAMRLTMSSCSLMPTKF